MADLGQMPSIPSLCASVGINSRTFYVHCKVDEGFKQGWEDVLERIEDNLVNTMVCNGQRPSGYMDRITWLRAYRGGKWLNDGKGQMQPDTSDSKNVLSSLSGAIDAEIVPEQPKLAQIEPKPSDIQPNYGKSTGQPDINPSNSSEIPDNHAK